jgi:5-methylcytosine-specific restriction protein A
MAQGALKPCAHAGCGALVPIGRRHCQVHKRERFKGMQRSTDGSSVAYDSKWNKARSSFLKNNPVCAECARSGLRVAATTVDHVVPHRGSHELFWDMSNWEPLCSRCHNSKTAREIAGRNK